MNLRTGEFGISVEWGANFQSSASI